MSPTSETMRPWRTVWEATEDGRFSPVNTASAMRALSGPDRRTMAIPPSPGAVAIAAMVSFSMSELSFIVRGHDYTMLPRRRKRTRNALNSMTQRKATNKGRPHETGRAPFMERRDIRVAFPRKRDSGICRRKNQEMAHIGVRIT